MSGGGSDNKGDGRGLESKSQRKGGGWMRTGTEASEMDEGVGVVAMEAQK